MQDKNVLNLQEVIYMKRKKLVKTADKHGIASKDTLKCSQELDKLIVEYQKYLAN
ncbi:aspartyl-phosphate phosphatase Spo0E family protein [Virgibacillus kekensis]|uniref:Aspartyl-phosphate phosphatase Spo0E family protein n=1 Tax=Virgibacillus kekensis TaxID=202261 RepID=A0ABV9DHP8_9BACI